MRYNEGLASFSCGNGGQGMYSENVTEISLSKLVNKFFPGVEKNQN